MSVPPRRRFLHRVAVGAAAVAISPRWLPANARVPDDLAWRPAPCRLCGIECGLLLGARDGRVMAMRGDPASPVNRGLACVKGYYAPQILYGRDRITRAMIRRNGALAPVALSEALDLVARRMRETFERHGPESVAIYGSGAWTAEDALVATRLARGVLGGTAIDTSARLRGASADAGLRAAYGEAGVPGSYDDIERADVFVIWSANVAESHPVLFSRMLERRRTSPAVRIIDLGTVATRTSWAADRSLLLAPLTELAVANAVCQEIVARGRANRAFVDRYVAFRRGPATIGHDVPDAGLASDDGAEVQWGEYVRFLEDYTPERVQAMSGLAADDIRWLASMYGDPARRVVSVWADGVDATTRGTWTNTALHNIHLLVGKVCSPGNAALPLASQPGGASLLADAMQHRPAAAGTVAARVAARVQGVTEARLDHRPARTALGIFRAVERGDVRMLWVLGGDPMGDLPHVARYRAALAAEDRFVVVSDAYPTPTTDVADVVLPSALWIERDGTWVNGERRVRAAARVVQPPGDAMSDAGQMLEVARRLGHGARFPWRGDALTQALWQELAGARADANVDLPRLDDARAAAGGRWPAPRGVETPQRYVNTREAQSDPTRRGFDFPGHADHRAWIWLRAHDRPVESPDAAYPLWLVTGDVVEHSETGVLTRRVPTLHQAVPAAYVELHPDDARALGVRDGDLVRLASRRGAVELEARLGHRCQPPRGRVFAPLFDERARVHALLPDAACPLSGQPARAACAVRVTLVRRRP